MADILIRMEMPKTCADCHDADLPTAIAWLGAKCPWANGIIDPGVYDLRHDRHPNCPLQELPEHGDLIDLDERVTKQVFDDYNKEWNMKTKTIRQWLNVDVNEMTVVIPSNKEDSRTMDEFMCGQECGNPEDGSL